MFQELIYLRAKKNIQHHNAMHYTFVLVHDMGSPRSVKKFAMMACEGFFRRSRGLCDSTAFCSNPFPVKLHPAHAIATDRARSTGPVAFPRI